MSFVFRSVAWAAAVAGLLYLGLQPRHGVMYDNLGACAGLGLIGLGLCLHARRQITASR